MDDGTPARPLLPALLVHNVPGHYRHADMLQQFARYGPIESVVLAGHDPTSSHSSSNTVGGAQHHAGVARVQFRQSATLSSREARRRM